MPVLLYQLHPKTVFLGASIFVDSIQGDEILADLNTTSETAGKVYG